MDSHTWVRLHCVSRFVDPAALVRPVPESVAVADDGTVTLWGQPYRPDAPGFQAGTVLGVRRNDRGVLSCRPLSAIRRDEQARRDAHRVETDRHLAQVRQAREAGRATNARLGIPVAWIPCANPYTSTAWHGDGRGRRRQVTYHVRLLADLDHQRLHRSAGEFLCRADRRTKWADLFLTWLT